ncbi:MAG: NUDIX domain-containing protein [Sterolibacterium sp.]
MNNDFNFCPRCAAPLATLDLGGLPRRACPRNECGFVHWDNPAPVVAALVERDGRIILARGTGWPEKMFGLITGFLERDESPREAVAREVKEELDLDTTAVTLIGVYPFQRKHEVIMAFHVEAEGEIRLNEELAEYRLIEPGKLRAWEYGTGLAVADWLDALRRKT